MSHDAGILISRIGMAIAIPAVIWVNVTVSKMAKIVHRYWGIKSDVASRRVIRLYREKHPDGRLWRNFKIAILIVAIGGVMYVSGAGLY